MSATTSPEQNPLLQLSYITILLLWIGSQVVPIPYVINLMLLVTSILYAACHGSLALREEQALARGEKPPSDADDDNKETEEDSAKKAAQYETLKTKDAMQFPLLGSASLFGLYLAFKFFDKETVNLIISVYFCIVGCAALTATLGPMLESTFPNAFGDGKNDKFLFSKQYEIRHSLPEALGGESPWIIDIEFNLADALSFIGSLVFVGVYFKTKHWTMNNVLGIAFCLQGIERFSLGTYKIGAILLVGLFFYDIFWVFGTDVMVTVAKSLDGPIKILFPRTLTPDPATQRLEMSLLGLGDIVIPGFFLALLLRFDAHNANLPYFPTNVHADFPKPYFHSALIGYIIGMGMTLGVMIYFEAAQPALLYLVPMCLGSSLACGFMRGELKQLFDYSEEEEEEDEEDDDKKKEDNTAKEKEEDQKKEENTLNEVKEEQDGEGAAKEGEEVKKDEKSKKDD